MTSAPIAMSGSSAQPGAGGTPSAISGNSGGPSSAGMTAAGASGGSSDPGTAGASTADTGGTAGDPAMPPATDPSTGPFPPVSDFKADGTFGSMTLTGMGPGNANTVYMPMQPPPAGAKNPLIVWMSGGGTSHEGYPLLPHLATHGFVVIAPDVVPGIGDEVNLGQQMIAALDWLIAENDRDGSQLNGRLDVKRVAAMGYSMGSLATFTIADDPRLTTTVHISGGNMEPSRVEKLKQPAAFICGTPGDDSCNILSGDCDIAGANCATDFMNATTPVFYAVFSYGHLGVLTPPYQDQIYEMTTAWLRYELMDDTTLAARFIGSDCSYCKDSSWKVQQKNLM
jgi:pimeloyl-ACP methyl ester carboxylesterase